MLADFKRPRAYRFVDRDPADGDRQEAPLQGPRAGARGRRRRTAGTPVSAARAAAPDPVITGIGAVTPLGHDVPTSWRRLVAGESGVGPITLFDASELPTRIAAEVKDFDAEALLGTKRARRSARFSQLAIIAAREAFADAGLHPGPGVESVADHERVGVVVNTAVTGIPETEVNVNGLRARGPAGRERLLRAVDDPQHARLRGRDRPRSAWAGDRQRAGLRQRQRRAARGPAADPRRRGRRRGRRRHRRRHLTGDVRGPLEHGRAVCQQRRSGGRQPPVLRPTATASSTARGLCCSWSSRPSTPAPAACASYATLAGGALTTDAFHISHPDPTGRQPRRAMRTRTRAHRHRSLRGRLHLRPRHRHADQRRGRDERDPRRLRRRRRRPARQLAQVDGRSHDRRRRRARR